MKKYLTHSFLLATLFLPALSIPLHAATIQYTITALDPSSSALAINNNSQITGQSNHFLTGAYLYSSNRFTPLPTLGGDYTNANALNNSAQTTGYSYLTGSSILNNNQSPTYHAFLSSNNTITDLGTLGGQNSTGYAVNNHSQIVGQSDVTSTSHHAFLYSNNTMTDLGTLGGDYSIALAINDSAQIVGQSTTNGINIDAFLYSSGTMTDLGTLGGITSAALAINNAGQITGSSETDPLSNDSHAFLYNNHTMTDITPTSGHYARGLSINSQGQVVGQYDFENADDTEDFASAFLYSGSTSTDLNSLIDPNSGWILEDATSINDLGQIVGYGIHNNNQEQAFLLTPITSTPEPTTLSFLALAALPLLTRKTRRPNPPQV